MTQIVLISGKQGSGKSTLTTELIRKFGVGLKTATEIRFAGPIYDIHDFSRALLQKLGIELPDAVKVKDGPMLQWLGTEWGRKTIADDVWVRCAQGMVNHYNTSIATWAHRKLAVISDCRFRNEFDAFPDALRVRLECPKDVRRGRVSMWRDNDTHPSEIDLDDYVHAGKFDLVFNSSTQSVEHISTMVMAQLDKNSWMEKRQTEV